MHVFHYFRLLKINETINAQRYSDQLSKLKKAINKRPYSSNKKGVILENDNIRPQVALMTKIQGIELRNFKLRFLFP
ncbi:transposase-like protein [Leptotrombidium deliense]|uniref:Transposase-like protein n=1 Tax=Leptotrombidium deliense TaxID=299467 RepID=A0A443RTN6_9ACAR|nr:transposase-like protein [Leptotrombidium deliense]